MRSHKVQNLIYCHYQRACEAYLICGGKRGGGGWFKVIITLNALLLNNVTMYGKETT